MPFDWNDFLTLAEELAARDDQASKRTAISRAYYSVFHAANARAERTTGRSASLGNSHFALVVLEPVLDDKRQPRSKNSCQWRTPEKDSNTG
jgi:hypothetical protein